MTKKEYLDQLKQKLVEEENDQVYQILAQKEQEINDLLAQGYRMEDIIKQLEQPNIVIDVTPKETKEVKSKPFVYQSDLIWRFIRFVAGFLETLLVIKLVLLTLIIVNFGFGVQLNVISTDYEYQRRDQVTVVSVCNDDDCFGVRFEKTGTSVQRSYNISTCSNKTCQVKQSELVSYVSLTAAPFILLAMGAGFFMLLLIHVLVYTPSSHKIKQIKQYNQGGPVWR